MREKKLPPEILREWSLNTDFRPDNIVVRTDENASDSMCGRCVYCLACGWATKSVSAMTTGESSCEQFSGSPA